MIRSYQRPCCYAVPIAGGRSFRLSLRPRQELEARAWDRLLKQEIPSSKKNTNQNQRKKKQKRRINPPRGVNRPSSKKKKNNKTRPIHRRPASPELSFRRQKRSPQASGLAEKRCAESWVLWKDCRAVLRHESPKFRQSPF